MVAWTTTCASSSALSGQIPASVQADSEEIALAVSAVSAAIGERASVLLFREGDFVRVRQGDNGFTCVVERFAGRSVFPTCYDRTASEAYLPPTLLREQRQRLGASPQAAEAAVDSAYTEGRMPPPHKGAMAYRLSPRMGFHDAGGRFTSVDPFIMIFYPFATNNDLGFDKEQAGEVRKTIEMGVTRPGTPNAYIGVVVARPKPPARP
jgi:hypothetical protein